MELVNASYRGVFLLHPSHKKEKVDGYVYFIG